MRLARKPRTCAPFAYGNAVPCARADGIKMSDGLRRPPINLATDGDVFISNSRMEGFFTFLLIFPRKALFRARRPRHSNVPIIRMLTRKRCHGGQYEKGDLTNRQSRACGEFRPSWERGRTVASPTVFKSSLSSSDAKDFLRK
jgi:hypothetical protein